MHTAQSTEREWHPTYFRLLLWNTVPFALGAGLADLLYALLRRRPLDVNDMLSYVGLITVLGVLLSLWELRSQRYVLRATATELFFPARLSARHGRVTLSGLRAPAVSGMNRAARLFSTLRLANRDGSCLAIQPSRYPRKERGRLEAFLSEIRTAA